MHRLFANDTLHYRVLLTVGRGVRLYAVYDVRVGSEHVDYLSCPLVPDKHSATVTPTQHPVVTKEVGLLDLYDRGH